MIQMCYGARAAGGAKLAATPMTTGSKKTARDFMSAPVLAARESWTVPELASWFTDKSISGAPVLDRSGRLTGVVSLSDIADQITRDKKASACCAADIMTPTLFTVPETTPLTEVARTMVAGRIHRLLVTRKGRVVGIVTTLDLLRELAGPSRVRRRRRARTFFGRKNSTKRRPA